jgi:hypothetical protein
MGKAVQVWQRTRHVSLLSDHAQPLHALASKTLRLLSHERDRDTCGACSSQPSLVLAAFPSDPNSATVVVAP